MNYQKYRVIKLNYIILLVIMGISTNTKTSAQQVSSDISEEYNYWAKRGIIEVIYAYMNDYIATVTDSTLSSNKKKKGDNEINDREKYRKIFIAGRNDSSSTSTLYDSLSAFLKNSNWRSVEKNVFTPLNDKLLKSEPLTSGFFLTLKPGSKDLSTDIPGYTNKRYFWDKAVDSIIVLYNKELTKSTEPVTTTGQGVTKEETWEDIFYKAWHFIAVAGILCFFFGIGLSSHIVKKRVESILYHEYKSYSNEVRNKRTPFFLSIIEVLQKHKNSYKNEKEELEKRYNQLANKTYNKVQPGGVPTDNQAVSEIVPPSKAAEVPIESTPAAATNNRKLLFFSIPESDGSFNVDKSADNNDGTKYYCIETVGNSGMGDLSYISNSQDKRAINRMDSYLKPACDIENIYYAESANKIELVKKGKVYIIDNTWLIDSNNKVIIRLV